MNKTNQSHAGFSLLELLIAMLIMSIIGVIAVNKYTERTEEARQNAAKAECKAIADAERSVEIDTGWYVSLAALDDNPGSAAAYTDANGLVQYSIDNELVPYAIQTDGSWYLTGSGRVNSRNWKGPYITFQKADTTGGTPSARSSYGSPIDPWGNPYKLFSPMGLLNPVLGETDFVGAFDRMAIVSYGKNGIAGSGTGTSRPGESDDVMFQF